MKETSIKIRFISSTVVMVLEEVWQILSNPPTEVHSPGELLPDQLFAKLPQFINILRSFGVLLKDRSHGAVLQKGARMLCNIISTLGSHFMQHVGTSATEVEHTSNRGIKSGDQRRCTAFL